MRSTISPTLLSSGNLYSFLFQKHDKKHALKHMYTKHICLKKMGRLLTTISVLHRTAKKKKNTHDKEDQVFITHRRGPVASALCTTVVREAQLTRRGAEGSAGTITPPPACPACSPPPPPPPAADDDAAAVPPPPGVRAYSLKTTNRRQRGGMRSGDRVKCFDTGVVWHGADMGGWVHQNALFPGDTIAIVQKCRGS